MRTAIYQAHLQHRLRNIHHPIKNQPFEVGLGLKALSGFHCFLRNQFNRVLYKAFPIIPSMFSKISLEFFPNPVFVIPASRARRESFRKERKDSGQAGMTDKHNEFIEIFLCWQLHS